MTVLTNEHFTFCPCKSHPLQRLEQIFIDLFKSQFSILICYISLTYIYKLCSTILFYTSIYYSEKGSGAIDGKMLLVRIIENNKIDAYFRVGRLSKD